MQTIGDILKMGIAYLERKGIDFPRREMELILSEVLHVKRLNLYLDFEKPIITDELDLIRDFLTRRARREPLPSIFGYVDFFDCHIKVNKSVLIPRQETELLVEKIVNQLSKEDLFNKTLWDICCGSGCIGIALKKRFPQLQVILSDLSEEALHIARENAWINQVHLSFLQGDLLTPFVNSTANFIVCNPPYISEKEYDTLEPEVKNFEPSLALIGGQSGLDFYVRLARDLPASLQPNSKVWFEIGKDQGKAVKELFSNPLWTSCLIEKDLANHDRFLFLLK